MTDKEVKTVGDFMEVNFHGLDLSKYITLQKAKNTDLGSLEKTVSKKFINSASVEYIDKWIQGEKIASSYPLIDPSFFSKTIEINKRKNTCINVPKYIPMSINENSFGIVLEMYSNLDFGFIQPKDNHPNQKIIEELFKTQIKSYKTIKEGTYRYNGHRHNIVKYTLKGVQGYYESYSKKNLKKYNEFPLFVNYTGITPSHIDKLLLDYYKDKNNKLFYVLATTENDWQVTLKKGYTYSKDTASVFDDALLILCRDDKTYLLDYFKFETIDNAFKSLANDFRAENKGSLIFRNSQLLLE